ncbi:MAG: hypothetical protein GX162_05750 [Firmicutes bacterium]|mgnify:CR=1 FL=1|jgi:Mor family transcriptional regulator|nr:hypothetical protein [Bacillota bacterium]
MTIRHSGGVHLKIYRNAAEVLPPELLEQLQEYVQGVHIYVPIKGEPARWGEKSGTRRQLAERNEEIRRRYAAGENIDALASCFFLSCDSVRKIIRKQSERQ